MTMINPTQKNYPHDIILALVFIVLTFSVLGQANPGTELPSRDSGSFIYMARQIIKGQLLYQDVWDSKPPAIFYTDAFALKLGRGTRWGIWLVEFLFLYGSIFISYLLINKLWGKLPALFGVFVWSWGLNHVLDGGNYTEEYPLLFHFISLYLFLELLDNPRNRLYHFLLGLMFSASFLFRPNNSLVEALVIAALFVIIALKRDLRGALIAILFIAIGILGPLLITSAYFWSKGLFPQMVEASITYNLTYGSTQISSNPPLIKGFEYLSIPAWVALIGYVLALLELRKHKRSNSFYVILILIVGSPLAVYFSDLARRNYPHYYMNWLPFMALLAGLAWYSLSKMSSRLIHTMKTPALLPSGLALTLSLIYFFTGGSAAKYQKAIDHFINGPFVEIRSPISIYVENHTRPGEYVLFWATQPGENFMSHRDAPFSNLFYPTLLDSKISDRLNAEFLADIKRTPPVLIVDMGRLTIPSLDPGQREKQIASVLWPVYPPKNLDEVFLFISANYMPEAVVKDKPVYRLIGTSRP